MKIVNWIACLLLLIGGLNWGIIGLINVDVVAAVCGVGTMLTRVIYILVGLSALYKIFSCCGGCKSSSCSK